MSLRAEVVGWRPASGGAGVSSGGACAGVPATPRPLPAWGFAYVAGMAASAQCLLSGGGEGQSGGHSNVWRAKRRWRWSGSHRAELEEQAVNCRA